MDVDEDKGNYASSMGAPESGPGRNPAAISVPAQLPSSRGPPGRRPEWESPLNDKCEPPQAPHADRAQYDQLTWDQLHGQSSRGGFRRK